MTGLRKLTLLALALPFAAAASEPAREHGGAPSSPARPAQGDCPLQQGEAAEAPSFASFPAPRRERGWVAPVLSSRDARLYRSTLGGEVANGPNFAGNYTLAAWGCGTSCTTVAIVAARNGRVFFPPQLRRINTARLGNWDGGRGLRYRGLRFCRDSRLLVVVGRWEGGSEEAASYFEWTGTTLRPLDVAPHSPGHS